MTHYCATCGRGYDGDVPSVCAEDGQPLRAIDDSKDLYVGRLIGGRFRLVELLGKGGAGTVYRAIQQPITRTVAVKLMEQTNIEDDEAGYRRFVRESKLASSLHHPNIVSPVDFGIDSKLNAVYFAMEYIEGIDLEKLVKENRLTIPLALEVIYQTCSALIEAHDKGVIHRDLKPGNVRLAVLSDGTLQVKVLDLGIARPMDEDQSITREEDLTGTAAYIPPEYIVSGDLGEYSDFYSLGVVLFELLCGQRPFYGNRLQLLFHQITTPPPELNDLLPEGEKVPREVSELVADLLEKKPEDRPQNARIIRERIEEIRKAQDIQKICLDQSGPITVESFRPWLRTCDDVLEVIPLIPEDMVANLKEMGADVITSDSSPEGIRINLPTPAPLPGTRSDSDIPRPKRKLPTPKRKLPTPKAKLPSPKKVPALKKKDQEPEPEETALPPLPDMGAEEDELLPDELLPDDLLVEIDEADESSEEMVLEEQPEEPVELQLDFDEPTGLPKLLQDKRPAAAIAAVALVGLVIILFAFGSDSDPTGEADQLRDTTSEVADDEPADEAQAHRFDEEEEELADDDELADVDEEEEQEEEEFVALSDPDEKDQPEDEAADEQELDEAATRPSESSTPRRTRRSPARAAEAPDEEESSQEDDLESLLDRAGSL